MKSLLLFLVTLSTVWAYYKVSGRNVFELDGNVLSDGATDWSSIATNDFIDSVALNSGPLGFNGKVFHLLTRDAHPLHRWTWHHPPHYRNLLASGYVVAYADSSSYDVFFALERRAHVGGQSSYTAIWLFQDNVSPIHGGRFLGHHRDNDIMISVGISSTESTLLVYKYKSGSLQTVYSQYKACNDSSSEPVGCVVSNRERIQTGDWGTISASRAMEIDPYHFIEGAVNLQKILTEIPNFRSILVEHRDNTKAESNRHDFFVTSVATEVSLQFYASCADTICKTNNNLAGYKYKIVTSLTGVYNVTLKNTGKSPIYRVAVVDATGDEVTRADVLYPNEEVSIPQTSVSTYYNASGSTSSSGYPVNVKANTASNTTGNGVACFVPAPSLQLSATCRCLGMSYDGKTVTYQHGIRVYNEGPTPMIAINFTTDPSVLMKYEWVPPFCPGQALNAYGSIATTTYPLLLTDYVTGTFAEDEVFSQKLENVACDLTGCPISPSLTIETTCSTGSGQNILKDTICNRGNVQMNITSPTDTNSLTHTLNATTLMPGDCTSAYSPGFKASSSTFKGKVTVTGRSAFDPTDCTATSDFNCDG